jgi:sugar phosphate isomerase/epimerase
MSTLAVSSFSLHRVLGPLRLERRNDAGEIEYLELPMPREHTLEEFAVLARDRLGVSAVELCQIQFDSSTDERVAELATALGAAGVRVLAVPIDAGDLLGGTELTRAEDVARIEHWFAIAERLGATYVRVNTGNPVAASDAANRPGLIDALRTLAKSAQELGLRLLIENHGGASSDPDFLLGVRAEVGSENLGILLDLGNFEPLVAVSHGRFHGREVDDTRIDREPVYANIARLAPEADLVHAKAYDNASDGTPLLDLDRALGIVADSGYTGSVSVEWEGLLGDPWERTADVVAAVRRRFPQLSGS